VWKTPGGRNRWRHYRQCHIELHGQVLLLRGLDRSLDLKYIADAFDLVCVLLDLLPKYHIEERGLATYHVSHDDRSE
jgi:hypothetical protein